VGCGSFPPVHQALHRAWDFLSVECIFLLDGESKGIGGFDLAGKTPKKGSRAHQAQLPFSTEQPSGWAFFQLCAVAVVHQRGHHTRISQCGSISNFAHLVGGNLAQDSPHDFPAPGFR